MIELLWNAPVSEQKMATYITSLDLAGEHHVLDVGCGAGEPLLRVCARYGTYGLGVDCSAEHIEEARRRAHAVGCGAKVKFVVDDALAMADKTRRFDLVMCMGATHAFGLGDDAFRNAIERMKDLTNAGGLMLVADGYMKQPAASEYRAILGDAMPDDATHAANVAVGQDLGLTPLAAWTSTIDEWDDFEWSYQRIVESAAREAPLDNGKAEKLTRRQEWMDAYLKWGRDTLGYGTYLFRKS